MKHETANTFDKTSDLFEGQNNTNYHVVTHLTRIEAELLFKQTYINMKANFIDGIETIRVPPLGVGHNGLFYLGWDHARRRFIGIKLIERTISGQIEFQRSQKGSYETLERPKHFNKELEIQKALLSLNYPHFLPIFDFTETKNIQEYTIKSTKSYQMVELAGLGDLEKISSYLNLLINRDIKNDILRHISKSILEALQTLHRLNYFHGDITLDNVVITHEGEIKLIDFEYTTHSTTHFMAKKAIGGEIAYDPPELWNEENYNTEYDAAKVEAWRIGLILLNLATGFIPLSSNKGFNSKHKLLLLTGMYEVEFNEKDLFENLNNYPDKDYIEVIKGLLSFSPEKRSSIDEVLLSGFFNQACPDTRLKMALAYLRELTFRYPYVAYLPTLFSYTFENASNSFYLPSFCFFGYIQRSTLQQSLLDNLTKPFVNSDVQITNLYGEEGVGKTQLAVWVVHSPVIANYFDLRVWFRLDSNINLYTQFNLLGKQLNFNNPGATLSFLNDHIEKHKKPWLIIFDNVAEYNHLVPYLPKQGGHILITSRTKIKIPITNRTPSFSAILVEPMTTDEAMNLLYCLIPFNKDIKQLVDKTKCLPLALVHQAAYILRGHTNFDIFESEQEVSFEEPDDSNKSFSYLQLSESFLSRLRACLSPVQFKDEGERFPSSFKTSLHM